jgi:dTDP-L-rhamnose 4-epimerase
MRVLVTGGAGFIGSAVVDHLVADGHEAVVLDAVDAPHGEREGVARCTGDIRDPAVVRAALRGIDAVSHQAAMVGLGVDFDDIEAYVSHNDLGTAVLLRTMHAAGFTGRLVLASSMVVYGEGGYRCAVHGAIRPLPRERDRLEAGDFEPACPRCGATVSPVEVTEADTTDPRNVYAATKLHQEHLCAAYGREHASSVIALRYHNVYGLGMPHDTPYAGVAALFRSALARGEAPRVFEDGGQRRDFVHVDDVARANVLALTAPADVRGAHNVATGVPRTVLDLANALCDASATDLEPVVVGGYRLGDVRHVFASPALASKALGFRAETEFAVGMAGLAAQPSVRSQ